MSGLPELIGNSAAVLAVRDEVCRLLQRQAGSRPLPPILIQGETGTGKGLLAGAIHGAGPRRAGPFVSVNCAAIPETLLEAELFGFERGAFTDARQAKAGLVQTAHGGTLFLDEIGLLPGPLQGKLLTVLEERTVRRLGGIRSERVDIAILSATSDDLGRAVRERRFTEALYHRLSVVTLRLPPLRERGSDIVLLAEHFLARAAASYNAPPRELAPEARAALLAYPWPGNVRELSNRMERVTLLAEPGLVTQEMLGLPDTAPRNSPEPTASQDSRQLKERVDSVERASLIDALAAAGGNLTRAAERLGMARTTLRYRLRKHGLAGEPQPDGSLPNLREPPLGGAFRPIADAATMAVRPPETVDVHSGDGQPSALQSPGRERGSEALPPSTSAANGCPTCGVENPPAAEVCERCGTSFREQAATPGPVPTAGSPRPHHEDTPNGTPGFAERVWAEAERRQLTVLACGLTSSTELSEQVDPEDLHEVVRAFQAACAGVIRRFEGHVAQYMGDGLVLYFGYPRAHEDDAQRAVRTGLGIVEEIGALKSRLEQERRVSLSVRMAIHTGVVVVGEMGVGDKREQLALGEVPDIATQLQGLAQADTVVISPTTYRLIKGYFNCRVLGSRTLRGRSEPLAVFEVLQEGTAHSRLDVAIATGLTPLVGRQQEVELLLERWERAKDGLGQVVLLSGEPGIGKSRLVQVVTQRIAAEPHASLECRCSPYYQNTAFYPVIETLHQHLKLGREDPPQGRLGRLEEALEGYGLPLEEVVPLLAPLLSLPLPDRYRPLSLTPQRQKQKTLEVLLACLLREQERHVTLFVWEDLQWVDASTLELLSLLIEQAPTRRLLILLTFRPDFSLPWANRTSLTHVSLGRLTPRQAETMVLRVAGDRTLPAEVLHQLVARTDGVPLFLEESTKTVLESEVWQAGQGREITGPLPPLAIPSTLQDSLMARLDRLGAAKQLTQLASTLGREFSYELIHAVSGVDDSTLEGQLSQLVQAELLYPRGLPPQARYSFKHALIQEAAYHSLLKSTRRRYHNQIAKILEERFGETRKTHPELLAHHYSEAGLTKEAVVCWQEAGQRALEHSANVEAIGHLTKGLELLKTLPETPERTSRELTFQLTLGTPLMMLKGQTAPEVEQIYTRAHDLCQRGGGDDRQRFAALAGLYRLYLNRARLRMAQKLGGECLALAERVQDPVLVQEAHQMLGSALLYLGEFRAAHAHLERGLVVYDARQRRGRGFSSGADPAVVCFSRVARALWILGYPEQAQKRIREALSLAEELSSASSLVFARHYASVLCQSRREARLAQEWADAVTALAREQGFVYWVAAGMCMRGWAMAAQGKSEAGLALFGEGLAAWRKIGVELAHTHMLGRLAESHATADRTDAGLRVIGEALAITQKGENEERHYEAELHRIKGELLLAQHRSNELEAEACFREALDIARRQQAKSLELRAVMSLGRLLQRQSRRVEARDLVARVYGWFSEGLATADLQDAQGLLEALT